MKYKIYCNRCGVKRIINQTNIRFCSKKCGDEFYRATHDRRSYWSNYYFKIVKKNKKLMEIRRKRARLQKAMVQKKK